MRRFLAKWAVLLGGVLVVSILLAGCGTEGTGGGTDSPSTTSDGGEAPVLTVEQALEAPPGSTLRVQGALIATGDASVLASAVLESYPPQAGGATIPLMGLDLSSLVGLSSTIGQPDLVPATWTDYWIVLQGVVDNGVLEVRGVPRVVETVVEKLRVRFSPVSEPLVAGQQVWWAFDIENLSPDAGGTALGLTFSSGQRAEVVLAQAGVEKYRWSTGRAFTQMIETVPIGAGQVWPLVLNDTLTVDPGDYDLAAFVSATIGPEGATIALPELTTTVTVH